jgi:glycosyltransferase involved in cell wall biosynthesis
MTKNKKTVIVVIPTTASRLNILDKVLDSLYSNTDCDIKTIIVKNGKISDRVFMDYDFRYPNIIKTTSTPGGHIAKAMNVGLSYMTDEAWFLYQEDDLVIDDPMWLGKCIAKYNTIDSCGCLGIRLHGGQRKYNPRKEHTIDTLRVNDIDNFEVYWSDGIQLFNTARLHNHSIRYDEYMMTVPNADINLQMLEHGYSNWRTEINFTHYHTPGSKTGTPKWEHADTYIDMQEDNFKLWLKYKDTTNKKIREFVDMDLSIHGKELQQIGKHTEDYKSFKHLIE